MKSFLGDGENLIGGALHNQRTNKLMTVNRKRHVTL